MPFTTLSLAPFNFLTISCLSQTCNKFPVGAWYSARCFGNRRMKDKDPAHEARMIGDQKGKGNSMITKAYQLSSQNIEGLQPLEVINKMPSPSWSSDPNIPLP